MIFNLPLTVPQDRSQWFRPRFLDPQGQPVFQGGVTINRDLQPLDGRGGVVYHNLWAAGGLLGGTDPLQEHSLEGIALATGVSAGEAAASVLHVGVTERQAAMASAGLPK
jgi:glycerol-3-phosphate dehydrogenase subunit B